MFFRSRIKPKEDVELTVLSHSVTNEQERYWDKDLEDSKELATLNKELKDNPRFFKELPIFDFTNHASAEDLKQMISVRQHAYAVRKFNEGSVLGTMDVLTCVALVAVNFTDSLIGLAHLDGSTITPYKNSLGKMLDEMRGRKKGIINIYLIGGFGADNTNDYYERKDDFANSRTLVLSLITFLKQWNTRISGTNLFKFSFSNFGKFHLMVKINESNLEFFHISDDVKGYWCIKNAADEQIKLHGTAIDETGLVCVERPRNRYHFPIQKLEKILPNKSSDVNSPVISLKAF